jgi:hypothetical protein
VSGEPAVGPESRPSAVDVKDAVRRVGVGAIRDSRVRCSVFSFLSVPVVFRVRSRRVQATGQFKASLLLGSMFCSRTVTL